MKMKAATAILLSLVITRTLCPNESLPEVDAIHFKDRASFDSAIQSDPDLLADEKAQRALIGLWARWYEPRCGHTVSSSKGEDGIIVFIHYDFFILKSPHDIEFARLAGIAGSTSAVNALLDVIRANVRYRTGGDALVQSAKQALLDIFDIQGEKESITIAVPGHMGIPMR